MSIINSLYNIPMVDIFSDWLTFDDVAEQFGYNNVTSFRRRLRELRSKGSVIDLGKPPSEYKVGEQEQGKVNIYWLNARTALIHKDVPRSLLNSKKGKRARKTP
jgi:hypothetical protein